MAQSPTEVLIYEADGDYRVFPPVIRLDAAGGGAGAEKLTLTNMSNDDLVFYAGADVLDNANKPTTEAIPAGESVISKPVKSNGNGKRKIFSYQVVSPKTGKKAKGSSDPKIIIDN